jgi:UDP-glucuronate 4-epimerase
MTDPHGRGARVVVTGGAGFIGSHVVERLVRAGAAVLCIDDFNDSYDPREKQANLVSIGDGDLLTIRVLDIRDPELGRLFADWGANAVIHLAARAGVRASVDDPILYQSVNAVGTTNVLHAARRAGIERVVIGSSSSVYGLSPTIPFRESDPLPPPVSPYAASKVGAEVMAQAHAHLYPDMCIVALRYFTVYGPRQRPDLAIRKFAERILAGKPIALYGDGSSSRDYTYVSDIVNGTLAALERAKPGFSVYNLGNGHPIALTDLVAMLERLLGREAKRRWLPPQRGDVERTFAAIDRARDDLGYEPQVGLEAGLSTFVRWLATERPRPVEHAEHEFSAVLT